MNFNRSAFIAGTAGAAVSFARGSVALLLASAIATANETRTPVVIELFTSEGCSSCPPADAALLRLWQEQPIEAVEVIPLELHVDYWNQQGWIDPYSSADNSVRQQVYQRAFGSDTVYTPEAIVDGRAHFVADMNDLRKQALAARGRRKVEVALEKKTDSGGVVVESSFTLPANAPEPELWIAVTESGLVSPVARGENAGRLLIHAPVVRQLTKIAAIKRESLGVRRAELRVPVQAKWKRENLRVVAFLQEPKSLQIVGAASVPL